MGGVQRGPGGGFDTARVNKLRPGNQVSRKQTLIKKWYNKKRVRKETKSRTGSDRAGGSEER